MNMFDEKDKRDSGQGQRSKTPALYKPFDASTLPSRDDIDKKISHNLGILLFELNASDPAVRHDAELAIDKLKLQVRKQVNAGDTFVQAGEIYLVVPESIISEQINDSEYRMRNIHRVEQLTTLLNHNFDIHAAHTFSGRSNGTRIVECVKHLNRDAEHIGTVKKFDSADLNTVHLAPILKAFSQQSGKQFSSICNTVVSLLSDQVPPDALNAYLCELKSEEALLNSI
jgi:hypothetical protein